MASASRDSLGDLPVDQSAIEARLSAAVPKLAELLAELFRLEATRGKPDLDKVLDVKQKLSLLIRENPDFRLLGKIYRLDFVPEDVFSS